MSRRTTTRRFPKNGSVRAAVSTSARSLSKAWKTWTLKARTPSRDDRDQGVERLVLEPGLRIPVKR